MYAIYPFSPEHSFDWPSPSWALHRTGRPRSSLLRRLLSDSTSTALDAYADVYSDKIFVTEVMANTAILACIVASDSLVGSRYYGCDTDWQLPWQRFRGPSAGPWHIVIDSSITAPPPKARVATQPTATATPFSVTPAIRVDPTTASAPRAQTSVPLPSASLEQRLRAAIAREFGSASVSVTKHVDPEEGWEKLVMNVDTGISDFDCRLELEDRFYENVASHESLIDALRHYIVSFS
jgi:hypothetical protein